MSGIRKKKTIKAFVSQIPSFVITINQPANGTLEVKEGSNVIATGTPVLEGTVLTDLQGKPFVGAAGKFLDEMLAAAGLQRPDVYITNIVK